MGKNKVKTGSFVPVLNFPNSTDLAGIIIYQVFIFSFIAWLILSRAVLLEYSLLGEVWRQNF